MRLSMAAEQCEWGEEQLHTEKHNDAIYVLQLKHFGGKGKEMFCHTAFLILAKVLWESWQAH